MEDVIASLQRKFVCLLASYQSCKRRRSKLAKNAGQMRNHSSSRRRERGRGRKGRRGRGGRRTRRRRRRRRRKRRGGYMLTVMTVTEMRGRIMGRESRSHILYRRKY
jgi:hypothetical protein